MLNVPAVITSELLVKPLTIVKALAKLTVPEGRIVSGIGHLLATIHYAAYIWVNRGKSGQKRS